VSWGPLQPARIDFSDARAPAAPDFGDVYPTGAGALAQARQVFLAGNGLPGRWAGRIRFVVLETGFGLGHNFLATWQAWQDDPQRCDTLYYLAIEKHPARREDLQRAHAPSTWPASTAGLAAELVAHWPPLTPDLHLIDFASGRVRLLLALGDIADVLPELVAQVDAVYLDGFAPERNPAMWDPYRLRSLARLAAPQATLATWCTAGAVHQGLRAAGFEVQPAPGLPPRGTMTVAHHAPHFQPPAPPGRQALAGVRRVAVVGAGLAGAAVARALAAQGLVVQVFERQGGCARETSGNAGGLFHGIVHGHDGPHARWLRAAAIHTERVLRPLLAAAPPPGGTGAIARPIAGALAGLLRGEQTLDATAMSALLDRLALPADYVQAQAAPWPGGGPAWLYPGGGWVAPADLCAHWLAAPGITAHYGVAVHRLVPGGNGATGWWLLDADGRRLAEADAVLLCNAADAQRLAGAGHPAANPPHWPLQRVRGQTTLLPADLPGLPDLPRPLADTGYVLRLADGRLLCGASAQAGDEDGRLRADEHAQHLATLRRLTGWAGSVDPSRLDGRVGWRLQSGDRLPLLGPIPVPAPDAALASARPRRLDQPRLVPRQPGLYVFTALGSRGISQAALGGEVLAAWLTGAPVPLPASLLDALDPARFVARAVRRAG